MVADGRQLVLPRLLAGQLGRDCSRREIVDRGGVAVPGGRAREAREVGEQLRVDVAVGADERAQRQLVEHDVDDRHRRLPRACDGRRLAREHQRADGRDDEEQEQHDDRGDREDGDKRAHTRDARVQRRAARADQQCDGDRERRAAEQVADRWQHERRDQQGDEHEHRPPPVAAQRPHDQRAHQRWHERVAEREDQDVAGRVPARDEELRVVLQQVEQRLSERQRPQAAEVHGGPPEADQGRASKIVRVSDIAALRSTVNRSSSARPNVAVS